MNNPLPASCCLVPARALPAACRTAFAGAVSVLPERFLFFPQTDGGTWLGRIGQQILYLQFSSNASLQLQCLHQRDILCLCCAKKLLIEDCCVYYRQQQHCAMPDPTIEPDAARVGHAVAACTFAAPGAANYCRFAHAVRFWGIAGALQLCPCQPQSLAARLEAGIGGA